MKKKDNFKFLKSQNRFKKNNDFFEYHISFYNNRYNHGNETVEFEGQLFNKSDLSEETLEWLEWYNSIPQEKQLAVNSIPAELYTDDGAGTVDADQEK